MSVPARLAVLPFSLRRILWGHSWFILNLLPDGDAHGLPQGDTWPFHLVFLQMLLSVTAQVLATVPPEWLLAFAALWVSHGVSFVSNFLLGSERELMDPGQIMMAPTGAS